MCTENILSEIRLLNNIDKFLFFSDKDDETGIRDWIGPGFHFHIQNGNDLGDKMENAFRSILKKYQQVIIIGTDIPDLNKDIILDAYKKLDNNDFVIGPSNDGGYYLLGMKSLSIPIFEDIEWSMPTVLKSTIAKIDYFKKKYQLIECVTDVDTREDLLNWIKSGKNKPFIEIVKKQINYLNISS